MRYIALLRGINVGGKNMIKMDKLRETFAELGFDNVKTYINSGNIAFDAAETSDAVLAPKIHDAILKDFGFDISVMVRSREEINAIVAKNPYHRQFESHKYLHVFFLQSELTDDEKKLLMEQANDSEFISVDRRTVYYLLKISILDSSLGKGFLDRKLKIANTARNGRTVQKLADL